MDVEEGVLLSELITDQNTSADDIPDKSSIARLDSLLKCGICYDYFDTCVITDCSHNFCSLCIRRYIQYKTECPVCFKELYDSSLRANRIVDEFRELFPDIKDRLLRCIRTINSRKPNCVYASPAKNTVADFKTPKSAHSASSKSYNMQEVATVSQKPSPIAPSVAKPSGTSTPATHDRVLIPKMFFSPTKKCTSSTEKMSVMQECPVCNVFIPERNMNRHLDDCLKRSEEATKAKTSPSTNKRAPLPKLVFRLLTTNNLRNKAKEYGLNPHGDNETLKTRIQKYTALHNAECDKSNPRPISELIRQLEREEKQLVSQKLPKNNIQAHFDDVTEKSKLNAQYLKQNKKSFDNLIEKMKNKQVNKKNEAKSTPADYCQPSTSKTHFDLGYGVQNDDMLEFEDTKMEKVEKDSQELELARGEKHSSEDDDVLNPIKRRNFRSKRLDFDEFDVERVKLEPEIEIYETLTDDENEKPFGKDNGDETDDMSDSPVFAKSTRRKRKAGDESIKKNLRKKKR